MSVPRLLRNILLLCACWAPLCASASDRVLSVRRGADWGRLVSWAASKGGGADAIAARLDGIRQKGGDCKDGMIPPGVADFAAAQQYQRHGLTAQATARYRAAATSPLGDHASFKLGEMLNRAGDHAGARTAYGSVSPASSIWVPARINLAASLMDEKRPGAAVVVLDDLLDGELDHSEMQKVRMAMIDALMAAGERSRAESLARVVWFNGSGQSAIKAAADALDSLGRPVSPVDRVMAQVIRSPEKHVRKVCRAVRRAAAQNLRLDPGLPGALDAACLLTGDGGAGRALVVLSAASAVAVDPDLKAWIRKLQCDAYIDVDDETAASGACLAAVREHPDGPFAATAGFSGALAFMRDGSHDGAISLLDLVRNKVPPSGSANRVRWARAMAAMMAGRDSEALGPLEEILAVTDRGDGVLFGLAEKARYFRGVVLYRTGSQADARSDLERVARGQCCSWYGVLAASRLEQWFGIKGDEVAQMPPEAGMFDGTVGSRKKGKRTPMVIPDVVPGDPALPAVYLHRLGDSAAARRELSARARRGLLDEEGLMALAVLNGHGGGGYLGAFRIIRGTVRPETAAIWESAWPRPFYSSVERAVGRFAVDPALVWAVMRVESNFKPSARSPVGARGLMQVMVRTAAYVSRAILAPAGIRANFRVPAGNIMTGVALLDQLAGTFNGNLPLVLASYNAGSGAGRNFLRRLGHLEIDVLAEAIPYERTRHYIAFVGGQMAAYRYLYGNSVPFRVSFEEGGGDRPGSGLRPPR